MSPLELFFLSVGLAMDAFAVAVCKGLAVGAVHRRHMLLCGLYFGLFQALMPVLGFALGARFEQMLSRVDHWLAFILLGVIGLNMIREARGDGDAAMGGDFAFASMFPLAVATSIDALVVGVTFAFLRARIVPAVLCIGVVAFILSAAGVYLGGRFGLRFRASAEAAGGGILIGMGCKILLEHLLG